MHKKSVKKIDEISIKKSKKSQFDQKLRNLKYKKNSANSKKINEIEM